MSLIEERKEQLLRTKDVNRNPDVVHPMSFDEGVAVTRQEFLNEVENLKGELERERMRLAGCGVAALGYFQNCAPEYDSASLQDTLRLYKKYDSYYKELCKIKRTLLTRVDQSPSAEGTVWMKDIVNSIENILTPESSNP